MRRAALGRVLLGATLLAVAAGLVLVGVGAWQLFGAGGPEPTGAERRSVEQVGEPIEAASASRPTAVSIPVIGFSAAIEPMGVGDSEVLDPPTADDVFWLEDYGLPGTGSQNTVYLVGHASADGRAVFDPLVDRAEQKTTVLPGDEVVVATEKGEVPYEVVSTERHDRTALADLEDVWTGEPGRLVLITCFFAPDRDVAPDNMVLFARQTGAGAGSPDG